MKCYMTIGKPAMVGYFTIDPTTQHNESNKSLSNFQDLDKFFDNEELEEIFCENVIECIPIQQLFSSLTHWSSKLKIGGTLYLVSFDIQKLVSELKTNTSVNIESLNELLYGGYISRKAVVPSGLLEEALQQLNYSDIEVTTFNEYFYLISGKKN